MGEHHRLPGTSCSPCWTRAGPVKEVLAARAVDPLEIGCALLAEFNVA
jgi:hypothetical protein